MKVMVAEHSRPEDVASNREERSGLMTSLAPPEQWHVWITRRSCFSIAYRRNSFTLGYEGGDGVTYAPDGRLHKNTQSATMLVGHLLIHVFGTRIGWTFSFQDTSVGRAIIPIHPYVRDATWPPERALDQAEINRVAHAFNRYSNTMPWLPRP